MWVWNELMREWEFDPHARSPELEAIIEETRVEIRDALSNLRQRGIRPRVKWN